MHLCMKTACHLKISEIHQYNGGHLKGLQVKTLGLGRYLRSSYNKSLHQVYRQYTKLSVHKITICRHKEKALYHKNKRIR